MKRIIQIVLLTLTTLTALAQSDSKRLLTGYVDDAEGEPLMGATVLVEGTMIATATDLEGKFSLNVPKDKKLQLSVSFIGYTTKSVPVAPNVSNVKVRLEINANEMSEVVVIGYGTAKKSSLTSSVETLKAADLLKIPSMNLDQSLQGQVAGLGVSITTADPSSAKEARISVRGNTSNPLLVIDGIPRFGSTGNDGEMRLSDLNPDDIESISILKDAAAAAVYGVRAANGVILVQTKRGKTSERAKVNYRGQFNFEEATNLPKFLDAYDYARLFNNAIISTYGDNPEDWAVTPIDLSLIGTDPNVYGNENLMDHLSKWGHTQQHSVSISGGNSTVRYYVSGGYSESKGLYSNVGRNRYNYSAKLDADLLKGLTMSIDLTGSISRYKNPSYLTLDAAYAYSPLEVLRYSDGKLASIEGSNPLIDLEGKGGYSKNNTDFHTLSAVLRYDIPVLKGLQAYVRGTVDMNHNNTTDFSKPVPLYIYDPVTGTTSVDSKTVYPKATISMSDRHQSLNNKLVEFGLNYSAKFAEKHEVTGLAVFNYQDYTNKYLVGRNDNLPGEYPEVIGNTSTGSLSGSEVIGERASIIGRATYGYDNRYFAEFSFRSDGSTRFAPGKRWGFFPTVSASWVISNESFFSKIPQSIMSVAKVRASAGILGDDGAMSDFGYLHSYNFTNGEGYNFGGVWSPTLIPSISAYPNPNLTWGKSKDINIGIDLGFWDNRFSATVEWFQRTRTNMVTDARDQLFPPSVGTGGVKAKVNVGKVRYRGVDFSLKHLNHIGDFRYNVSFNIGTSTDKVLDWGDESTLPKNKRLAGHSFSVWNLYEAAGLFQSEEEIRNWPVIQDNNGNRTLRPGDIKYVDQDHNGILDVNDMIYVKDSSLPEVNYGFGFGAEWKGFYFNAQFVGAGGYNQRITELYTLQNGSLQRFQDYHLNDTWTPDNPNAAYPRVKFATSGDNNRLDSTFWLRKCNFLRLRSLCIGYRVPSKVLKNSGISSLDISLQGSNLHTWSSLDGMDPEVLRGYPLTRGYGISLSFGL